MTNTTNITSLPMLLSDRPLTLIYCLPLLLASLPLVFAGTFLTLFRTASFKPLKDNPNPDAFSIPVKPKFPEAGNDKDNELLAQFPFPGAVAEWDKMLMREKSKPKKRPPVMAPAPYPGVPKPKPLSRWRQAAMNWRLEGGVGGLLLGFVFGVHLTVFLALAVAHSQPTYHLAPSAFLFLWLLTSTFTTILAGRFRSFTFVVITTGGPFALTILASLTLSMSLKATVVILALLSLLFPIPGILSVLPISYNHPNPLLPPSQRKWSIYLRTTVEVTSRIGTSAMGAACMLQSIALLAQPTIPSWDNPMSVFFSNSGNDSSANGKALALTIFGWILYLVGVTSDWALARFVGASKAEEWDAYLATYARNLPDRAGHFEEEPNVLQRLEKMFGGRSHVPSEGVDNSPIPDGRRLQKGKPSFFQYHSPGKYRVPPPWRPSGKKIFGSSNKRNVLLDEEFDSSSETEVDDIEKKMPSSRTRSANVLPHASKRTDDRHVNFDIERDLTQATKALETGAWKPSFLNKQEPTLPRPIQGDEAIQFRPSSS